MAKAKETANSILQNAQKDAAARSEAMIQEAQTQACLLYTSHSHEECTEHVHDHEHTHTHTNEDGTEHAHEHCHDHGHTHDHGDHNHVHTLSLIHIWKLRK